MLSLAVDNTAPAAADDRRRAQLAKHHIARKAIGLDEDDYRAMLERLTGHRSAANCNAHQLDAVMGEFERMGFRPLPARRASAGGWVARKARAMWISLYQLGAIDDRSEKALDAFGRRQLGVDRLQWANERVGYRLIEALKAIAERHGWDQSVPARLPQSDRIRLLKDRLVAAQLARLSAAGKGVSGRIASDREGWSDKRLEHAAAELGAMIRSLPEPP